MPTYQVGAYATGNPTFFAVTLPIRSFVGFVFREGFFVKVHGWRIDKLTKRFHGFCFVVESSDRLGYTHNLRIN